MTHLTFVILSFSFFELSTQQELCHWMDLWIGYITHLTFVILSFSFSSETFSIFCHLPSEKNACKDALVLRVYRGVRFSLLQQCHITKKINIWVTKNNIASGCHRKVKWRNFMVALFPLFWFFVWSFRKLKSFHAILLFRTDQIEAPTDG